jgi:RNA-binding protein YlmH
LVSSRGIGLVKLERAVGVTDKSRGHVKLQVLMRGNHKAHRF